MEETLSHSFESVANYPDEDFPPPLVIHARKLDGKTIRELAQYMLELVELRYDVTSNYRTFTCDQGHPPI